ncbi:MAG: PilC/PilY family type IV pilus protein [Acidobacteriota bacterium]
MNTSKLNKKSILKSLSNFSIIFLFILIFSFASLSAQNISDYCSSPPFITTSVTPNVLIILDNSEGMMKFAYPDFYNSNYVYYGYFDSTKRYTYTIKAGGYFEENVLGEWSGNFLNWLSMRRIDIARKVLIGGKTIQRSDPTHAKYLVGESSVAPQDTIKGWFNDIVQPYQTLHIGNFYYGVQNGNIYVDVDENPFDKPISIYTIKINVEGKEIKGIIQDISNKVRLGLMYFNKGNRYEDGSGPGTGRDGAYLQNDIGEVVPSIITSIENKTPDTFSPVGEALYEAIRMYQGGTSAYNGGVNYKPKDPIQYRCQKNFVIIISDGNSSKDKNLPGGFWGSDVADPNFNVCSYMNKISLNENIPDLCSTETPVPPYECLILPCDGTFYLEGVSFYAHTNDLRSDFDGIQNLTLYTIKAFGAPDSQLLQLTAKYGGFDDKNGNNLPDLSSEWDKNGDGNPDNFFEAQNGEELESAILSAITDILKRVSAGTAASVLSTSSRGFLSIIQAQFTPTKQFENKEITWTGHLKNFWLDPFQNIREETAADGKLNLKQDYIIQPFFDESKSDLMARYFKDTEGTGKPSFPCTPDLTDYYENAKPLWKAEEILLNTDPGSRKIFTFVDSNKNKKVDTGEIKDFTVSNKSTLRPFFRVPNDTEAEKIIRYIRGEDVDICLNPPECTVFGHRDRTVDSKVWKLGDIIHSTPRIVSNYPINTYHIDYYDYSYKEYFESSEYKNKLNLVLAGGNDGMLHAFNLGKIEAYYDSSNPSIKTKIEGTDSGKEMWAYIPYNLIPHLPWLAYPDYCHIYYVDNRVLVVDASIGGNPSDIKSKNSWRTILIGSMRFGGKEISVTENFGAGNETRVFRSGYFALDITDPVNPSPLWEFTDEDLGFTTSFPAVLRFGEKDKNGTWYVVLGNGPTDFEGNINNNDNHRHPFLYVINLKTGELIKKIDLYTENPHSSEEDDDEVNSYVGDLIAIDPDKDFIVDTIYGGTVYVEDDENEENGPKGTMLRIQTKEDPNPSNWTVSTLIYTEQPITASPEVVFDERMNVWVIFGTGVFLSERDRNLSNVQSLYGIKDTCWNGNVCSDSINIAELFTIDLSDADPNNDYDVIADVEDFTCVCNGFEVPEMKSGNDCQSPSQKVITKVKNSLISGVQGSNWQEQLNAISAYRGWRIKLPKRERVITKPFALGGIVDFLSFTPSDDPCEFGGETKLYTVYYRTGTSYLQPMLLAPSAISAEGAKVKLERAVSLGYGIPPPGEGIAAAISKEGSIQKFIQISTGIIVQSIQNPPYNIKNRAIHWIEK